MAVTNLTGLTNQINPVTSGLTSLQGPIQNTDVSFTSNGLTNNSSGLSGPTITAVPSIISNPNATSSTTSNPTGVDLAKLFADAMGASGPVSAPYYDIEGNRNVAKGKAEAAQNPYYDKQLQNFLAGESLKKQQAQESADLQLKTLQDTLKQQLDASELGRTRTTEDTATARDQLTDTFNQNNQDVGTANDEARVNQARKLFVQGTLTSGVGQGEVKKTQGERLLAEQRASQEFDRARVAQELFKSRTFEDLAKSDELANLGYSRGAEQNAFDLASFIANQQIYDDSQTLALEHERQATIANDTENFYKIALNNWIAQIKDPRQLQAARSAYGG